MTIVGIVRVLHHASGNNVHTCKKRQCVGTSINSTYMENMNIVHAWNCGITSKDSVWVCDVRVGPALLCMYGTENGSVRQTHRRAQL